MNSRVSSLINAYLDLKQRLSSAVAVDPDKAAALKDMQDKLASGYTSRAIPVWETVYAEGKPVRKYRVYVYDKEGNRGAAKVRMERRRMKPAQTIRLTAAVRKLQEELYNNDRFNELQLQKEDLLTKLQAELPAYCEKTGISREDLEGHFSTEELDGCDW